MSISTHSYRNPDVFYPVCVKTILTLRFRNILTEILSSYDNHYNYINLLENSITTRPEKKKKIAQKSPKCLENVSNSKKG